jgi:hypothetical protein
MAVPSQESICVLGVSAFCTNLIFYFGFSQWYDVEYQPNPTMHCQVLNSHAHGSVNYLNH